MNTKEIEALLDKFYAGNSSLSEEQSLREFFLKPDVPEHLKKHQNVFAYYASEHEQTLNDPDFDNRLNNHLTGESIDVPAIPGRDFRHRFLFAFSIAASVLHLVGLFFTFQQDLLRKDQPQILTADQEIALAEANEALLIISSNFNAGLKQMERLQTVDKAMKNMQLFNKFYKYETLIINPDEILQQSIKSN